MTEVGLAQLKSCEELCERNEQRRRQYDELYALLTDTDNSARTQFLNGIRVLLEQRLSSSLEHEANHELSTRFYDCMNVAANGADDATVRTEQVLLILAAICMEYNVRSYFLPDDDKTAARCNPIVFFAFFDKYLCPAFNDLLDSHGLAVDTFVEHCTAAYVRLTFNDPLRPYDEQELKKSLTTTLGPM